MKGIVLGFMICLLPLAASSAARAAELDFFTALDQIIARNQNLAAEESLNRSERITLDRERWSAAPTLKASLNHSLNHAWGEEGSPKNTYWQAEMGLNLYRFGQDSARNRLAEAGDQHYDAARQRQILDAEQIAADKLLAFLYHTMDRAVLEKIQTVRERLHALASKQYGKGLLPQQEVKKVDIDLRSLGLQIKQADVQVEQARLELARYLGADRVIAKWPFERGTEALSVLTLKSQHPLSSEARERLLMEKEREKILWATQYPSLDALAVANRSFNGSPFNRGRSEFLVSLTIPLLDQTLNRSLYRAQQERSTAAAQQLDDVEQGIEVQRTSAAVALRENVANLKVYEELIDTARELFQGSLSRFERGLTTVNDLGVDEARLYNAERDRVQSWYSLHRSWLAACQSLGMRLLSCSGRPNS